MSFIFQSTMLQPAAPKPATRRRRSHRRQQDLKPSRKCFDGRTKKQSQSGQKPLSSSSSSCSSSKGVAERLEALKRLIPSMATAEASAVAVSPDRLFEETANYILLLRTHVTILKHLVDLYSPAEAKATTSRRTTVSAGGPTPFSSHLRLSLSLC